MEIVGQGVSKYLIFNSLIENTSIVYCLSTNFGRRHSFTNDVRLAKASNYLWSGLKDYIKGAENFSSLADLDYILKHNHSLKQLYIYM
jgi:hypothetical protein